MASRVRCIFSAIALLAIALWLGGLAALGAIAAPVVFSVVPLPRSADAMTIVFRRFDRMAMACAAVALACEAASGFVRAWPGGGPGRSPIPARLIDHARVATTALAAAAAVVEGAHISPRIAELHAGGAIRGVADAGAELARLHNVAEWLGQTEVVLLAVAIVFHAFSLAFAFSDRGARQFSATTPG